MSIVSPARGTLLAERRVVVVGAGTRPSADDDAPMGNGRATALRCAVEGAHVACVDVDGLAAETTARLIVAAGGRAEAVTADVADAGECATAIDDAVASLGGIDGLVLNVGIGLGSGIAHTSAEEWDRTFAVNAKSHFLLCQGALPSLRSSADGGRGPAVVFVSSVAGLKPGSRIPAYDASKAALGGLCRQMAAEGARHGIRANVVAPGLIDTPLGRAASAGRPGRDRTPVPLGRMGTAEEVASVIVFLLSSEAAYVTGQVLAVDGGLSTLL